MAFAFFDSRGTTIPDTAERMLRIGTTTCSKNPNRQRVLDAHSPAPGHSRRSLVATAVERFGARDGASRGLLHASMGPGGAPGVWRVTAADSDARIRRREVSRCRRFS